MNEELMTVPLLDKENSDARHHRLIVLLISALIITNIAWSSTWIVSTRDRDCTCEHCVEEYIEE